MLRVIAILVLLVSFAAQTFQQAAIVLDYHLRTAAYEKTCENKARPQLHCNGKCQMAKKLREQEQKEQQAPQLKLDRQSETFAPQTSFALAALPVLTAPRHTYPVLNTGSPIARTRSIFHPPALV